MTAQTTYTVNMPVAYDGQLGDMNPKEIISLLCETAAGVSFGRTVSLGTADDQGVLGGTAPIGVAVRELAHEGAASTAVVQYNETEAMSIIRDGYVYALIADNGSRGAALNSVDATGAIGVGAAGAGETDLTGWTLEQDVVAGNIALIRVKG